jgi:ABC-type antimicrobial peptide transport system permease subunit
MALGAPAQAILQLFMSRGVRLAAIGIGIGIAAALSLSTLLGSTLYGVSNRDPITFILGSLLLLLIAAAATYLPARRATRIEPMEALRYE